MKWTLATLALLFLLALAVPASAQSGNTLTIRFAGVPTGTCAPFMLGIDNAAGTLYDCKTGAWNSVGGGGGGTCPEGTCIVNAPTADQTIAGAHKLVMSAVDSGLVIGGSGPGATTAPFVLFGSGSSFSNGGEMTPSNAYTTLSMWNSTHGGLYIEGVADGSDGSGNVVPAFSLNGVWTAAQTLPAGHAIMEMIGNSPNSATQAPANTQLFGVNSDFSSNILAVFDSGGGAGGIRPGFLGLNLDTATPTGVFDLRSGATSSYDTKPLLVVRQGTTGQTGDLLELQNSTGTNLAKVDSTGLGTFANVIDSGLTASKPVFSDSSKQLTSTGTVPVANGGTGTGSTLTGLVRGNSSAMTAAELSGVVVSSGSNVTTPGKVDVMQSSFFCADAGSNDTYACSLSPAATAYVAGAHYWFKANTANTGAATINFNSVGATTIKKAAGGITTDLADNDIRAGQYVDVVYDGTNMEMQSTLGNAAGAGTVTSVATTSPITGGTITSTGTIACATCVTSAAALANGGLVLGTAGTQASATNTQLTFSAPTLTVGLAGTSSGILGLTGSTSGSATLTAPATAGTVTNAITISNGITVPSGAAATPSYAFGGATTTGFHRATTNIVADVAGVAQVAFNSSDGLELPSGNYLSWSSSSDPTGNRDSSISRSGADILQIGSNGGTTGKLKLAGVISVGTKFAVDTGCGTVTSTAGGATAGVFTAQATGACTVVITMGNTATATNGWDCSVNDRTTGNLFRTSASTTTTATVTGTAVSGDVISFHCGGY